MKRTKLKLGSLRWLIIGALLSLGLLWDVCLDAQIQQNIERGGYQTDVLGEPYESLTLGLKPEGDAPAVATLVRHRKGMGHKQAVLYIHGYNDYFFQREIGDSVVAHDYGFYALDLRRYGRSMIDGQRAFEVKNLREYYEEIALAIETMRLEGVEDIHLLAHSTGCLVASLYLADTKNRDGVRTLMLNSPFLDYYQTPFLEKVALPTVVALAWIAPDMVVVPARKSGDEDGYAKTLQETGRYPFDVRWKKPQGYPIRASWLRAIKRGHRQVYAGLHLELPILLMSSSSSTLVGKRADRANYHRSDIVLDVEDMWRYGSRLGRQVYFFKIQDGLHDLFRSSDKVARETAYKVLGYWLDRQKEGAHGSQKMVRK